MTPPLDPIPAPPASPLEALLTPAVLTLDGPEVVFESESDDVLGREVQIASPDQLFQARGVGQFHRGDGTLFQMEWLQKPSYKPGRRRRIDRNFRRLRQGERARGQHKQGEKPVRRYRRASK
jgi:hypothetical protein